MCNRSAAFPLTIHVHWRETAKAKGFDIIKRIKDRYHLLLSCRACGGTHVNKLFVVMNNQPSCPHCVEARWQEDAAAAGLEWAGRDPDDRHYGLYIAPCGHRLRRQFEMVKRAAEGVCDVRCEICHEDKEQAEAEVRGWKLLGPDPQGNLNYRLYRHTGCGHRQRVARANMQSGRFQCACCGTGWSSAGSFLYAMQFKLACGLRLIKLGYSRDPHSRLRHQLLRSKDTDAQILKTVPISTGHAAVQIERRLHAQLKAASPDSIAPHELYRDALRVRSEIYFPDATQRILGMLEAVETAAA